MYADGQVKWLDGDGKQLASYQYDVAPAAAPDLMPDTKNLVVLPLPWRTPQYIAQKYKLDTSKTYARFTDDAALALLAAYFAANDKHEVARVWRQCFLPKGDKRLGFFTLFVAAGFNEIDRNRRIRRVILFDGQFDSACVALYWNE